MHDSAWCLHGILILVCLHGVCLCLQGCQNCLTLAKGNMDLMRQCLTCVRAGSDAVACGTCLGRSNPSSCYQCLSANGSNFWANCRA